MLKTRGFTLLEMMVVVAILVAIAGMVLPNMVTQFEYAGKDISESGIKDIRSGTFGQNLSAVTTLQDSNHQPMILGFVADAGRLPIARGSVLTNADSSHVGLAGTSSPAQLRELWEHPNNATHPLSLNTMRPYGFYKLPAGLGHEDVKLPCGWRGPYISSALKTVSRHFTASHFNLDALAVYVCAANGEDISAIKSFGPDGPLVTPDLSNPVNVFDNVIDLEGSAYKSKVTVKVLYEDGTVPDPLDSISVVLFVPNADSTDSDASVGLKIATTSLKPSTTNFFEGEISIGPRAVRGVNGAKNGTLVYFTALPTATTVTVTVPKP